MTLQTQRCSRRIQRRRISQSVWSGWFLPGLRTKSGSESGAGTASAPGATHLRWRWGGSCRRPAKPRARRSRRRWGLYLPPTSCETWWEVSERKATQRRRRWQQHLVSLVQRILQPCLGMTRPRCILSLQLVGPVWGQTWVPGCITENFTWTRSSEHRKIKTLIYGRSLLN